MQVPFFVIIQSYMVIVNCEFAVRCKDEIAMSRVGCSYVIHLCACRAGSGSVIYHQSFWKHVDQAVVVLGKVVNSL